MATLKGNTVSSTEATETVSGGPTNKYTYDADSQLATWTLDSLTTTYTYDVNGNIGSISGPGKTMTLGYGYDNRLVGSILNGAYTGYTFDDNGNLTQKSPQSGNVNYTWDSNNELLHISGPSLESTYTYDAEGRRTSKTINGTTTQFVYDGIKLVAEKDASGTITATYFYEDNGRLVSMKKNGQSYYFHLNHRGDVIQITDSSETTVAAYAYDPWGNILDSTGTFAYEQPFRYASYYWDSEIGMYYLMARYYDPQTGRFISKDPCPGFVDDPKSQMPYSYAENNPIIKKDPDDQLVIAYYIWFSVPSMGLGYYFPAGGVSAVADRILNWISILSIYKNGVLRARSTRYVNVQTAISSFISKVVYGRGTYRLNIKVGTSRGTSYVRNLYKTI